MAPTQIDKTDNIERQLRVSRVAEILDISRASVYDLINKGELKAKRIGCRLRIPISSVRRLLEQSK